MANEIANAYIAIYAKMPGIEETIKESVGGPKSRKSSEEAGKTLGQNLLSGMEKIGKAGLITLGTTLAAGLGTALVKGFQRLDSLDQAEAKLRGLGHSAATVDQIMDDALASVKGTAFGMDAAATTAASAVAAGIKPGQDLQRTLKLVADAATIAGVDMATMGSIVNKVATADMMQMDVANQLMDAGIPIMEMLASTMGVTAVEARKMASDGQISFADFQEALDAGLGGAALESGNTFSGAMDNVMASIGRMGANLLSGIFPQMKDGLGGLIDALGPLEDVAKGVGEAIGGFFAWIADNWHWLSPFAIGLGAVVAAISLWTAAQWLLNAALTANPVGLIVTAIGLLIGAIILLVQNWDTVVAWITDVWQGFVDWIMEVIDGFVEWWNGIWEAVGAFIAETWEGFVGMVTDIWTGFVDWVFAIGASIAEWWNGLWAGIGSFFTGIWEGISSFASGIFSGIKGFFESIFGGISDWWSGLWDGISETFQTVWTGIGDFFKGIANGILDAVEGFVNGFIDIINGITGGINWATDLIGIPAIPAIPKVNIPRLAEGGIVQAQRGGILANIGEGRYDEAVIPLSPSVLGQLSDALAERGGGGPSTFHLYDSDGQLMGTLRGLIDAKLAPLGDGSVQSSFGVG